MAKSRRRKRGRQTAPSKTTTPVAVRVPNELLENVRRTARAVQREGRCVYYPDETSASLKAFFLQALSAQVEARITQNRAFFDKLDWRGQDRERSFGLCVERLTELDPLHARRELVRWDPEQYIIVLTWPRSIVGRLENVPQATGKRPTGKPIRLLVSRPGNFFR